MARTAFPSVLQRLPESLVVRSLRPCPGTQRIIVPSEHADPRQHFGNESAMSCQPVAGRVAGLHARFSGIWFLENAAKSLRGMCPC